MPEPMTDTGAALKDESIEYIAGYVIKKCEFNNCDTYIYNCDNFLSDHNNNSSFL